MKNLNISMRAYEQAADLQALSAIWFGASHRAHAFIGRERLLEQRILIETQYLPSAGTWVACYQGKPAGFISLLDTFIGGLFVAPDYQGHGIGRLLVAHALKLKGKLRLEVYTENARAFSFYKSLGFEELSRRAEDDEGPPFENADMLLKG